MNFIDNTNTIEKTFIPDIRNIQNEYIEGSYLCIQYKRFFKSFDGLKNVVNALCYAVTS